MRAWQYNEFLAREVYQATLRMVVFSLMIENLVVNIEYIRKFCFC